MAQLFDSAYYDEPVDSGVLDNASILTSLYKTIFNREPDQEGFDFWLNALNLGYTPEFVRDQFLTSPEYADIQAKKNTPTPAPASTPLDPLFADPRYIEAKQLAQEYGAYPVTIGDTVYNVLADGSVETITPTDPTMQGQSLGAELGLFSPTGETIVDPYLNEDYGQQGVSDLLVNAALAGTVAFMAGPAGAGLLSTPAAAALGSGLSTMGATGDLETAAQAAALAGLSAGAGEALGLTGGTPSGDYSAAADAVQLAAQGIPEDQIVDILQLSGTPVSQALDAAANAVGNVSVAGSAKGLEFPASSSLPIGTEQVQVPTGTLSSINPLSEVIAASLPVALTPAAVEAAAPVAASSPDRVEVTQTKEPEVTPSAPTLADVIPAFTAAPVAAPAPVPASVTNQTVTLETPRYAQNTTEPVVAPLVTLPVTPRPTPTPAPAPVLSPAPDTEKVQVVDTKVTAPTPTSVPDVVPGLLGSTVVTPPAPVPAPVPAPAPAPDRVEVTETRAPAPTPAPSPVADVVPGLLGSTVTTPPAPAPAPTPDRVTVEDTKITEPTTEKPDALTPVYVPPDVNIPIPEVKTEPSLSSSDIQNIIRFIGGLLSGGAAGSGLGGSEGVGTLPFSDSRIGSTTPQFGDDYYAAVQRYYNAYMPETPRDVAGPLQQWYENKFGA